MATQTVRFTLRRGTAAHWTASNPTLHDGEPALETDTDKWKTGDGVTPWNSLAYMPGSRTDAELAEFVRDTIGTALTNGANITITVSDGSDTITIELSGTVPVANGGTGVTTSTGSGSNVLSASPTFTGTVNAAALTLSSTLTLNAASIQIDHAQYIYGKTSGGASSRLLGLNGGTCYIGSIDQAITSVIIASGATALATFNSTGMTLLTGSTYKINNIQVVKGRITGWAVDTGTAKRTANATYTAPTISNPPTQAEVQAIANSLQDVSQTMKAVKDDLHGTAGHGLIGT